MGLYFDDDKNEELHECYGLIIVEYWIKYTYWINLMYTSKKSIFTNENWDKFTKL